MKIRKILPLVILALASVFLLSSCDALLDAIFSNDTINVYVAASIHTYGYHPFDTVTAYVGSASGTASYNGDDGDWMYWQLSFPKLSDGTYTVQVNYPRAGLSLPVPVTVPDGTNHNVNVSFTF